MKLSKEQERYLTKFHSLVQKEINRREPLMLPYPDKFAIYTSRLTIEEEYSLEILEYILGDIILKEEYGKAQVEYLNDIAVIYNELKNLK